MLIKCKECGGKVSTDAQSCPHCGSIYFQFGNKQVQIILKTTLLNPNIIDDSVFDDGDHFVWPTQFDHRYQKDYITSERIIGIVNGEGKNAALFGGLVNLSINNKLLKPFDSCCKLHTNNSLEERGWHPIQNSISTYIMNPVFREESITINSACILISDLGYDRPEREPEKLVTTAKRVVCIEGCVQDIQLPPNITNATINVDIEIAKTSKTREISYYKCIGHIFKKYTLVSTKSIPIYQYVIKKIDIE